MAKLFERGDIAVRDARHGAAWFGGYEWSDLETLKADPNITEIMDESTKEVIFNREEEEENMNEYESKNAAAVLEAVENYIAIMEDFKARQHRSYRMEIRYVYEELSIFDWWNEYLSVSQLKDMRRFLKEAIKLGYAGYVCFKVGASGCSNGMWAYTGPTTDGYSPHGCPCLYKSFTPSYNYWTVSDEEGNFDIDEHEYKTIRELEAYIEAR